MLKREKISFFNLFYNLLIKLSVYIFLAKKNKNINMVEALKTSE